MIDFNCFVGEWPFHRLRKYTFRDLQEVHKANGIEYGYVSSVQSIFYNDFYEAEKMLDEEIRGSGYQHVVTANPTLSSCLLTLKRCVEEFSVKGIRLMPGYHGYGMDCDILNSIVNFAAESRLPLFINARMLDERCTHMIHPLPLEADKVAEFITYAVSRAPDIVIVLCHFKDSEAQRIQQNIATDTKVFWDMSGSTYNLLGNHHNIQLDKRVYGSGFPLHSVRSGVLRIDTEIEDQKVKDTIMYGSVIKDYL